jgi:DNA invertase Pin-like site-specific DNA recombinase
MNKGSSALRPTPPDETPAARPIIERAIFSSKIHDHHRDRLAIVYVRQSTYQQVLENRESTARQYDLVARAVELGWQRDRVLVIDEDQGRSGRTVDGRLGFQRLLAEVSLEHVGLVLGLEMSRLARSCKDWYQLLELCALFRTLLADQDGLYDPADFNDRLLLGLKGTMSEAEVHVLRSRMEQGRRNKARRGELFSHVPTGYIVLPSGEIAMDPDEQVRTVVQLIFDKFDEFGSLARVARYMNQHNIRLGIRAIAKVNQGQLEWRRASRITLRNILKHPIYAGAYSYGRNAVDPRRKKPGKRKSGTRVLPRQEWLALLKDHHPAYITWDRYESNLRQLKQNQTRMIGVPRAGLALLGGLITCARCGTRMRVIAGKSKTRYHCLLESVGLPVPTCQGLKAQPLDELIGRLILQVLEPASLELSVKAADDLHRERERLHQQWKQRLERARFNAERAARQYQVVEPENRLVARALEAQWETALQEQRQIQEEYERFQHSEPENVSEADREQIRALASDIPALWNASDTAIADRKTIIRHLIERIVIGVQDDSEYVDVAVHWAGGFVSHHELVRPVGHFEQLRNFDQIMDQAIRMMEGGRSNAEIAARLNKEGYRSPQGRPFTVHLVRNLLRNRGIARFRVPKEGMSVLLGRDEWWPEELARHLGMPRSTLCSWCRRGWILGRQLPGKKGRWIPFADAGELERLRRLVACPRGWPDEPYPPELTTPATRNP